MRGSGWIMIALSDHYSTQHINRCSLPSTSYDLLQDDLTSLQLKSQLGEAKSMGVYVIFYKLCTIFVELYLNFGR